MSLLMPLSFSLFVLYMRKTRTFHSSIPVHAMGFRDCMRYIGS